MTTDQNENARNQAKAQLKSIVEMIAALTCDYDRLQELREKDNAHRAWENEKPGPLCPDELKEWEDNRPDALDADEEEELDELTAAAGDCEDEDQARRRIDEDPLSVEVRGDWHYPGDTRSSGPTEFKILLCTGGPACQIIGDLDDHGQPENPRLMYQDWFTAWEELTGLTDEEEDALLEYCRSFYFEEN